MSTCGNCNCVVCVQRRAADDLAKAQGRIYAVRRFLDECKFLGFANDAAILAAVDAEQSARLAQQ